MENKKERSVDRIKDFAKWLVEHHVVRSEMAFERVCGLSNHYIKNLSATEKGNVGADTIAAIYDVFPTVSVKWLVTGKGGMFGNRNAESLVEQMRLDMVASEVLNACGDNKDGIKDALKKVLQEHKNVLSAEDKVALLERLL